MTTFSNFLESLLYQNEGTALDLKEEQYPFSGATEEQKSELLKDILAFANSWRQTDAYILIGVKEVQGSRHIPVGTEEHFNDAHLQQFVNSKTNRRVEFSYEVHLFEGKKIGVIKISQQERPTYLTKKYGKIDKEVVYYRSSSSTTIAKPEDIARMGRDSIPSMSLRFADNQTRQELGNSVKINSICYDATITHIPDLIKPTSLNLNGVNLPIIESPLESLNRDYWREKEEYIRVKNLVKPLSFVIQNQSSTLAEKVRVEIIGQSCDGIKVIDKLPPEPSYRAMDITRFIPQRKDPQIEIIHHGEQWTLTINFGNVKPKSSIWLEESFYIGSQQKENLEMDAIVYADNFPEPQRVLLSVDFEIDRKSSLTIDALKRMPPYKDSM